ncbi:hypothetical protein N9491_06075 [Planktomarina temperata]|nr:hypothetical protein [Planktomarina temperata]
MELFYIVLLVVGGAVGVGIYNQSAAKKHELEKRKAERDAAAVEHNAIALREASELQRKRDAQARYEVAQEMAVADHQDILAQSHVRKFNTSVEKETGANGIRIRATWEGPPGSQLVLYKSMGSVLSNEIQVLKAEEENKAVCLARMKSGKPLRAFDTDVEERKSYNYYVWIEASVKVPKLHEESETVSFMNITKGFRFLAQNRAFIPLETKTDHFKRVADESDAEVGALEALNNLSEARKRFEGTDTEQTLADKIREKMAEVREQHDVMAEMMDELPDDYSPDEKREIVNAMLQDLQNKGEI